MLFAARAGWAPSLQAMEMEMCSAAFVTDLGGNTIGSVHNSLYISQLQFHLLHTTGQTARSGIQNPFTSICSFWHLFHTVLSTYPHRPWTFPWLCSSPILISYSFTYLFAAFGVSGASKIPVIYVRACSRARYNSAADRWKKGEERLCSDMTALSLFHPTEQCKDTEQDERWGDFSLRFLCKSI